jgi:uncharacterized membrane protein (DUF106 family)
MEAERVQRLVEEEASLAGALRVVHARMAEHDRALRWRDVSDELSSGQWGRLIEKGVVEPHDDGFVLADRDAVEQALDAGEVADPPDIDEDASWSRLDKLAGLGAVVLFAGYSVPQIRNLVATVDNVVLAPLDSVLPFYVVILLLAVVTGLYSALLQANLLDREKLAAYQAQMKAIQDRRKAAKERGDEAELERIEEEQMEAMGDQLGMFKLQFRPMVWIMLLTIPVFLWMRWKIRAGHVVGPETHLVFPLIGQVGLQEAAFGPFPAWILWYFLCSMSFGQVIRKVLNIQPTTD